MLIKCNFCGQNVTLIGGWQPGELAECSTCHRGIGVVPGNRKVSRWGRRKRTVATPFWDPQSLVPFLDRTPYSLEEVLPEMKRRPGTLWAPVSRIKYQMCCAYTFNGDIFTLVGREEKPGPSGAKVVPEAKLPFGAIAEDWFELDPVRFYSYLSGQRGQGQAGWSNYVTDEWVPVGHE